MLHVPRGCDRLEQVEQAGADRNQMGQDGTGIVRKLDQMWRREGKKDV
jgi:hypothetical protein